jgi:hypothetical protein
VSCGGAATVSVEGPLGEEGTHYLLLLFQNYIV